MSKPLTIKCLSCGAGFDIPLDKEALVPLIRHIMEAYTDVQDEFLDEEDEFLDDLLAEDE